jgi:hypothetical protein
MVGHRLRSADCAAGSSARPHLDDVVTQQVSEELHAWRVEMNGQRHLQHLQRDAVLPAAQQRHGGREHGVVLGQIRAVRCAQRGGGAPHELKVVVG